MKTSAAMLLDKACGGKRLTELEALNLAETDDIDALCRAAATIRDEGHGIVMTYSRKVFIPLTLLCRDVCHYCAFARPPRAVERAFLTPEEVLAMARAGQAAGCREALFTLGDKPERRYAIARRELAALGHETTLSYLADVAGLVLRETGLFPHLNPGLLKREDIVALRRVSVSQGIMLESGAERLCRPGGPHYGSPDKHPALRLETLRLAGEEAVPMTTGLLIGIGETRKERIVSLLALRDLHKRYGHVQEIIIQNFRAKPGTLMEGTPDAPFNEQVWTIAVARLLFGASMNIQAPPNLRPNELGALVRAGINDWGGVSPVTPDFVNEEAPWPHLEALRLQTEKAGKHLVERLALYPAYACAPSRWLDESLRARVVQSVDADGFPRSDDWAPGSTASVPNIWPSRDAGYRRMTPIEGFERILRKAARGAALEASEIVRLFRARGPELSDVMCAADELRREAVGERVSYIVNRNINYTNICSYRCRFCAFSKGKTNDNLRGRPYELTLEEIQRRTREAWMRGATEVCLQGGIHPAYTGETYLAVCRAIKAAVPEIHIHAFSPLEVWQGARTLGLSITEFLARLKDAGLGSLPGTAAEILDDEIRAMICPDKITTMKWLEIVETAHHLGLKTTSTIMFGHLDTAEHWAAHLLRLRALQERTGGITEFVPLPFVHMEAPLYLKGGARRGPSFRECVLMHAVARLTLYPVIPNIQASWVKLGRAGIEACLRAGANDLGGTLMNETISRAAGAGHGQEWPPERMEETIRALGRSPRQRTTLYGEPPESRVSASYGAPVLFELGAVT